MFARRRRWSPKLSPTLSCTNAHPDFALSKSSRELTRLRARGEGTLIVSSQPPAPADYSMPCESSGGGLAGAAEDEESDAGVVLTLLSTGRDLTLSPTCAAELPFPGAAVVSVDGVAMLSFEGAAALSFEGAALSFGGTATVSLACAAGEADAAGAAFVGFRFERCSTCCIRACPFQPSNAANPARSSKIKIANP